MNYYDLVLWVMPFPILGTLALGEVALATLSLLLLVHALFVNPPTDLSTLHPKE